MSNVFIFDHPLIQHKVSLLRDKNTSTKEFRELVSEISMLMGYEVTRIPALNILLFVYLPTERLVLLINSSMSNIATTPRIIPINAGKTPPKTKASGISSKLSRCFKN